MDLFNFKHWEEVALTFLPRVLEALIILVVGFWVERQIGKLLKKYLERHGHDVSLRGFLLSFVSIGIKAAAVISAAGALGFHTTTLLAVFGAAGLAVGLALQGSLANFAGGVLVLIFRPFRVDDFVTIDGEFGRVLEIQIFNTILRSADNKKVILPNGSVSNKKIINHSRHGNVQLDIKLTIDFTEDFDRVKGVIMAALYSDPKVLKNPTAQVNIIEYSDTQLKLTVMPYALPEDYWEVHFNAFNNIRNALAGGDMRDPKPSLRAFMVEKG